MVTLALLADQLEIEGLAPHAVRPIGRDLKGVRIWPPVAMDESEYYVYIALWGDGPQKDSPLNASYDYLILADHDPKLPGISYLYIPDSSENLQSVLERTEGIFERYLGWSEQLLVSAVQKRDLGDLLDISAPIFKNPMYVADSAFVLMACTSNVAVEHPTLQWTSITEQGVLDPGIVEMIHTSQIRELDRLPRASFSKTVDNPGGRNINVHSEKDGVRIANLAIIESENPLHEYHLALADHLMQCIRYVIDSFADFGDSAGTLYERWIISLLQGSDVADNPVERRRIDSHLDRLGWKDDDWYQIAYIQFPARHSRGTDTLSYYWRSLSGRLAGHKCFLYEGRIVVLFHHRKDDGMPSGRYETLERFVAKNDLRCSVSALYTSIFATGPYLKQAIYIQKYLSKKAPTLYYPDCLARHALDRLAKSEDWKTLVHPIVHELAGYDRAHGSNLVETLYLYLLCDRSLKQCSTKLSIHRSTLVYRLGKIADEYHIDYDDEDLRLALILSCGLILSQQRG